MTTVSDVSGQVKAALVSTTRTLLDASTLPNAADVIATYGHPGTSIPDDVIAWTRVHIVQEPGPISPRRPRDLLVSVWCKVSVYRGGGPEAEQIAGDRAYAILNVIEEGLRSGDTTLGGLLWWLFCVDHDSDGSTDPDVLANGRVIEIDAQFDGRARITS